MVAPVPTPLSRLTVAQVDDLCAQTLRVHAKHPALRHQFDHAPRFLPTTAPRLVLLAYGTSASYCNPSETTKVLVHRAVSELAAARRLGIEAYVPIFENVAWPEDLYGYALSTQAAHRPVLPHLVSIDHRGVLTHFSRDELVLPNFPQRLQEHLSALADGFEGHLRQCGVLGSVPLPLPPVPQVVPIERPGGEPQHVLIELMQFELPYFVAHIPGRDLWLRASLAQSGSHLTLVLEEQRKGLRLIAVLLLSRTRGGTVVLTANTFPVIAFNELLGEHSIALEQQGSTMRDLTTLLGSPHLGPLFQTGRRLLMAIDGHNLPIAGELDPAQPCYFQADTADDRIGFWPQHLGVADPP